MKLLNLKTVQVVALLITSAGTGYLAAKLTPGPGGRTCSGERPLTALAAPRAGVESVHDEAGHTAEVPFHLKRNEIEQVLSNLNQVSSQARIVPSIDEKGGVNGYKLFSIQPGSIYERLGLQNGDVVKRINRHGLTSLEKVMEAFPEMRRSSRIEVELERGGRRIRNVYALI